jgi:hypothetical protein
VGLSVSDHKNNTVEPLYVVWLPVKFRLYFECTCNLNYIYLCIVTTYDDNKKSVEKFAF